MGDGAVTLAGAAFLCSLVLTGWTGLLLLLTPSFSLLLLPLVEPLRSQAKGFYRRVTRFV